MTVQKKVELHLIAAVARNRVIGNNGQIPWNIPEDLHRFKELTAGHTVIMGRRTFESIGSSLPGRENIVVTSTSNEISGCRIVRSLTEALHLAGGEKVFIIGGERLYREALEYADYLDLTLVDTVPEGDTYFPEVNLDNYEKLFCEHHAGEPAYTFLMYRKRAEETQS